MKTAQASWGLLAVLALIAGFGPQDRRAQAEDIVSIAPSQSPRPKPRGGADSSVAPAGITATAAPARPEGKGQVTNLPLPRYVSLKGKAGNARRGPSTGHRIDWVFTAPGMPLRITAEYENWRRVEDMEGMGGWVHYALLSGSRTVLIKVDLAEAFLQPKDGSEVSFRAERNVIARLLECQLDWCRINAGGEKGWVKKTALWGVDPGELVD
jgi:SH3-like domain-containing protein